VLVQQNGALRFRTLREQGGVRLFILFLAALMISSLAATAGAAEQKYPDVVAAIAQARGAERFDFDVTVSSPYDTPQRYADAFRVVGLDGTVYGERILFHDHADEQPFTRDLYGVRIPAGVRSVVVEGRDRRYGYGGKTRALVLPGR
jgi:hypothetical protein